MMKALEIFLIISFAIFFGAIVGTAFGALGGYIVGLFFTNTITTVMVALGFQAVQVWQLGAFLGFVGGFFRTVTTGKQS